MRSLVRASLVLLAPSFFGYRQEPATAPIDTGRLRPAQEQYLEERSKGFSDPDPERRRGAILDLARAGDAATSVVVERLLSSKNPLTQRSAILALYEIGTSNATAALERAFDRTENDDDLKGEELAVLSLVLGARERTAVIPALRLAAGSRRPSPFRRAATLALGRLGDVDGVLALLDRLPREPIAERRAAVLTAAGVLGARLLLPAIVENQDDDVPIVRRAVAFAVGEIGEAARLESLLALGRREKNEAVRTALTLAWGRIDHPSAREALGRATRDRSAEVRAAAWASLAARGDGADVVSLALAKEPNAERRAEFARACAAAPGGGLVMPLLERLTDRSKAVRAAAGRALAALDARGVAGVRAESQAILDWLSRESDEVARRDALLVVGLLELPGALDVLAEQTWTDPLRTRVERSLRGRLDPRLLRETLDQRLREEGGRLEDRRDRELSALVATCLDLDDVARRTPRSGGAGGPTEPSPPGAPGGKPRIDRRASSYERDLIEWFSETPYFPSADERARRR